MMNRTLQDLEASAQLIGAEISTLERLTQAFSSFYSGTVTLQNLIAWLLQFPTPTLTSSAIRVLSAVNFVDDGKLAALLARAFQGLPEADRAAAQFCAIGRSFDSGLRVAPAFARLLYIPEAEIAARWGELTSMAFASATNPLVLVDDNLASGAHFLRFLLELDPDYSGPREHLSQGLDRPRLAALKQRPLYLLVATELGDHRADTEATAQRLGFNVRIRAGSKDSTRWLDYGCSLWGSEADAAAFRTFAAETARKLFDDKGWPVEKRESRLLGYGNCQKLTVFSRSAPKSLVSLFWKFGRVDGVPWVPLFPERREWAKYRKPIEAGIAERTLIARHVISGGFGHSLPTCQAFLKLDGECAEEVEIPLPGDSSFTLAHRAAQELEPISPPSERWTEEASRYNKTLALYKQEVEQLALVALSLTILPLRIYNTGTAAATEVVLTFELPEGVVYHADVPHLPEPPKKPSFSFAPPPDLPRMISTLPPVKKSRLRETKDRGRRLLSLFVGKILPSTFRDVELEYLQLPLGAKITLSYSLVYEEASRPVLGRFLLKTQGSDQPPPEVLKAWPE